MNFKSWYCVMGFLDNRDEIYYNNECYDGSIVSRTLAKECVPHYEFKFMCRFFINMYGIVRHYENIFDVKEDMKSRTVYSEFMRMSDEEDRLDENIPFDSIVEFSEIYLNILEKAMRCTGWSDSLLVNPKENQLLDKTDDPLSGNRYFNVLFDGVWYFRAGEASDHSSKCFPKDSQGRWWRYSNPFDRFDAIEEMDALTIDVLKA